MARPGAIPILLSIPLALLTGCQTTTGEAAPAAAPQPTTLSGAATAPVEYRNAVVEASCGQCQFGLPGSGCDLAVRIDGVAYFVDGTGIDNHGDAHAASGLCNAVRRAEVSGKVVDGRFAATSFRLLGR